MELSCERWTNAKGIMASQSSEQMPNYFLWDWSWKRWTNVEGIMTSPPSEQMLNYFVCDWACKRWTNVEGIMTSPPGEQMLNYIVYGTGLANDGLMLKGSWHHHLASKKQSQFCLPSWNLLTDLSQTLTGYIWCYSEQLKTKSLS